MTWPEPAGTLVELVGGRWDGARLPLPPGPLPEMLGVIVADGVLRPLRSATARLAAGCRDLYEPTTFHRDGTARYAVARPLAPRP